MSSLSIREFRPGDERRCETVLRALPDWFGIESALLEYVRDAARFRSWLVESSGADAISGGSSTAAVTTTIGFTTYRRHFPESGEIHCLAVRPEWHRRGLGRQLIQTVVDAARSEGVRLLQVKTLGPSRPCAFYDRTRAFYQALGFLPVEEFLGLWPGNPCLQLVMPI